MILYSLSNKIMFYPIKQSNRFFQTLFIGHIKYIILDIYYKAILITNMLYIKVHKINIAFIVQYDNKSEYNVDYSRLAPILQEPVILHTCQTSKGTFIKRNEKIQSSNLGCSYFITYCTSELYTYITFLGGTDERNGEWSGLCEERDFPF